MSRPIRISKAHAWYYVENFSRAKQLLFIDQENTHVFCQLLNEASTRYEVKLCAFVLTENSYKLLLYCCHCNLQQFMRHINGLYTQCYNRQYSLSGTLFKGRYQASLLQPHDYPLILFSYILQYSLSNKNLLNSNHLYYQQSRTNIKVDKTLLNQLLKESGKYDNFDELKSVVIPDFVNALLSRKTLPSVIGDANFQLSHCQPNNKMTIKLPMKPDQVGLFILTTAAEFFSIDIKELRKTQRKHTQLTQLRSMTMYLCQQHSHLTLKEIAPLFGLRHFASVSNSIAFFKKQLLTSKQLAIQLDLLSNKLITISHRGNG